MTRRLSSRRTTSIRVTDVVHAQGGRDEGGRGEAEGDLVYEARSKGCNEGRGGRRRSALLVGGREVLPGRGRVGLDRRVVLVLVPVGRAHLAVLLDELERLDEADRLVDRATDGEVVDRDLAEGALGVDEEEAAEGNARILEEDAVVARDLHALVGDELELEVGAEAALVALGVGPREVRVLRVGRDGEDLGAELLKVGEALVEGEDLGRADEGD